jgi:hypothetical protein
MENNCSPDQLLEQCLDETLGSGTVDTALQRYPEEADRLRPLLEDALAVRQHYATVAEPPGGLLAGRERMLAMAARLQDASHPAHASTPRKGIGTRMRLIFASKLIGLVLVAVLGITSIGSSVALAASDSLPGDALYPAKLMVEELRMRVAGGPEEQLELSLDLADARISEIETLAAAERPIPSETMARIEHHLRFALGQAAGSAQGDTAGLLARIVTRTQRQAQVLEQLHQRAQTRDQAQLEQAYRIVQQSHEEATQGLADVQAFRYRYQMRAGMPEEVVPPEPQDRGPKEPAGNQQQEREQTQQRDQSEQQEQTQTQQQEQTRTQQQEQTQTQQQEQTQTQQQEQTQTQQQEQTQTQQQEQTHTQQQEQTQTQQQEQTQTQQQEQTQTQQQEQTQTEQQEQTQTEQQEQMQQQNGGQN